MTVSHTGTLVILLLLLAAWGLGSGVDGVEVIAFVTHRTVGRGTLSRSRPDVCGRNPAGGPETNAEKKLIIQTQ